MLKEALVTLAMPIAIAVGIIALCLLVFLASCLPILWRARANGVNLSLRRLIGMTLRKVQAKPILENIIRARQVGIPIAIQDLENQMLAGGNIDRVVTVLIEAKARNIPLTWMTACAIDLAMGLGSTASQICRDPRVVELFTSVALEASLTTRKK